MKIKIKMAVWTAVEGFAWQANSYQPEELRAFKEKMGKFPDRNLGDTIPYGGVFVCGDKLVFFREMIAERIDSHGRDALYCVLGSVMLENGRYIDLNKVFQSPEFSKPAANREFPQFMEIEETEWKDVPRSRREFMQGLDSISSPSDAAHYATYFSKGSFFCWFYGDDKRLSLRVTQKSGYDFEEAKPEVKTPVIAYPYGQSTTYPQQTNGNAQGYQRQGNISLDKGNAPSFSKNDKPSDNGALIREIENLKGQCVTLNNKIVSIKYELDRYKNYEDTFKKICRYLICAIVVLILVAAVYSGLTAITSLFKGSSKTSSSERTKMIELPGGEQLEVIYCPQDKFMTGSSTTDTKGFWLGKYEVTQAQWKSVMGDNPSRFKGDNFPVENVSWFDCNEFCGKVGQGARLPTEAEWEYACRAGTTNMEDNREAKQANCDNKEGKTTAVGRYSTNAWGFCDMIGNVNEWCSDYYDNEQIHNNYRVYRGGSYKMKIKNCRPTSRVKEEPQIKGDDLGFRLCFSE